METKKIGKINGFTRKPNIYQLISYITFIYNIIVFEIIIKPP